MDLSYSLNTFYFLITGLLVMWMAAGFTMLESGSVRSKNVTEILIKNVALYSVASIGFLLLGYQLMYGWTPPEDHALWSDFFFQVVFVATAMSIVSGAVAERMKLFTFFLKRFSHRSRLVCQETVFLLYNYVCKVCSII